MMADPKKAAPSAKKNPAKAHEPQAGTPKAGKSAAASGSKNASAPRAATKAAASALAKVTANVAPKGTHKPAGVDPDLPAAEAMKGLEAAVEAAKPIEATLAAPVAAAVASVQSVLEATPQSGDMAAPAARLLEAGAERAREAYVRAQATGEHLRQAATKTAATTTRGALEVNGKVIDALRAQSDVAFDVWRSTLSAGSFSEAIRLQTSGVRQVYETTASHWKEVAQATARWFGESIKPFQAAFEQPRRG
jgi:hypothetical protein